MSPTPPGEQLAAFAAELRSEAIPAPVLDRAEDLMVDWLGSALAGKGARPVEAIARFAERMGPDDGPSEVLIHRARHEPAVRRDGQRRRVARRRAGRRAQRLGASIRRRSSSRPRSRSRRRSAASGARAARRGRRRLRGRHPRRRVPRPLALQRLPHDRHRRHARRRGGRRATCSASTPTRMAHAFGSAGTQAAGLWEFLRDAADSKQLHTAQAAAAGLTRRPTSPPTASPARSGSSTARRGWRPACRATPIRRGSSTASARAGPSPRPRSSSTPRAATRIPPPMRCCRLMQATRPARRRHRAVTAHVHQGAIDVLGPVVDPQTVHQSKFSMGTVLGLIAVHGRAGLTDFDAHWRDARRRRVRRARRDAARRRGRRRLSGALDRQGRGADEGRPHVRGARRRAEGRSGQHASAAPRSRTRRSASRRTATARAATRWRARSSASARLRTTARVGFLLA